MRRANSNARCDNPVNNPLTRVRLRINIRPSRDDPPSDVTGRIKSEEQVSPIMSGALLIKKQSFGNSGNSRASPPAALPATPRSVFVWQRARARARARCRSDETIWLASTTPCALSSLLYQNRTPFPLASPQTWGGPGTALSYSTRTHARMRASARTVHWHTSLGADIYKHCVAARLHRGFHSSRARSLSRARARASYRGNRGRREGRGRTKIGRMDFSGDESARRATAGANFVAPGGRGGEWRGGGVSVFNGPFQW
jgi:hypothetical protein